MMSMLQTIIPSISTPQEVILEALQANNQNKKIVTILQNYSLKKIFIDTLLNTHEKSTSTPKNTPPTITNQYKIFQHKSRMGLRQIEGGNFTFHRKALRKVSLSNREGKLLELFIKNQDFFVSDILMDEKLYTKDNMERSQIVKLLKNKFKDNGIRATINRQGSGYILIHLQYLQ